MKMSEMPPVERARLTAEIDQCHAHAQHLKARGVTWEEIVDAARQGGATVTHEGKELLSFRKLLPVLSRMVNGNGHPDRIE